MDYIWLVIWNTYLEELEWFGCVHADIQQVNQIQECIMTIGHQKMEERHGTN